MSQDTELPFPIEDTPPITEPPQSGEFDHDEAEDDTEADLAEAVHVSQDEAEPGPDHPSEPAGLYPIPPKPALTAWVSISNAERLEKGELYAKKMVEIEGMQKERSEITTEINKAQKLAVILRTAFLSGKVEVPAEQTDLLRQPVGPESAAAQFEDMAQEAAAAALPPEEAKTVEELNAMAKDIQAGVPGTEASPEFENEIESFKAKKAKERKGKAR